MNEPNLTPKQKEILKSFRSSVADILNPEHDDFFLLRWLRARNFNEDKAQTMLRKHMKWRQDMKVDTLFDWYQVPEVFAKYHPGAFIGHDKEGCPVWLINSGSLDVKGFTNSSRAIDFIRYQIWRFETLMQDMKEQSKKLNKRIEKKVYIMDEENLVTSHLLNKPVLETLLNALSVFEANYPETLKRCYVINVPKPFFVLYSIIKPLLSAETESKVKIFGHDGWKEALLEDIDASVLPVHWGGTRVDPINGSPYCESVVNPGGTIPESYYLSNKKHLSEAEDTRALHIPKRTFVDVKVEVSERDSTLHWDIQTEENDLAMGIFYKDSADGNELEVISECKKIECDRGPESGFHVCSKAGTYVVRLDNSYSWFTSKKVHYRLTVKPPIENMS